MGLGHRLFHLLMKAWYGYVSRLDKKKEAIFLNYGYVDDNNLKLDKEDEINRYPIQLYHQVANAINLNGLNVLEVGCGRGGGASYIARYLKPKSMKGVDLCKNAIKFCKEHYSVNGLSFSCANALNLPFEDNSFDAAINIESSHGYSNMDKFLGEIHRVLKPQGYFLFADFRYEKFVSLLKTQLANSGLNTIKEQKITSNVLDALNLDNKRRLDIIERQVHRFFHKAARQFAGLKGTELYNSFVTGKRRYLNFVLQKP